MGKSSENRGKEYRLYRFGVNESLEDDDPQVDRRAIRIPITLGDVLWITGLPIDSEPVIEDLKGVDFKSLSNELLRTDSCFKNGASISVTLLKEEFGNKEEAEISEPEDFARYLRALFLYVIGSVIVPSNSQDIHCCYLLFLRDIEKIKDYAWGAAMLAIVHRALEKVITNNNSIACNAHFLTMAILEYIPKAASLVLHNCNDISVDFVERDKANQPNEFPIFQGWHKNLLKPSRSRYPPKTVESWKYFFRTLTLGQIEKNPYGRLPPNYLPRPLSQQVQMERSLISILCMEKHDRKNKDKPLKGEKRNWKTVVHRPFVDVWEDRGRYRYIFVDVAAEEMLPMEWSGGDAENLASNRPSEVNSAKGAPPNQHYIRWTRLRQQVQSANIIPDRLRQRNAPR
ncbi:protein MAIN-LIKE 1 [Sesamum alatum]|uniref:Protein MAIN-LIKE 1 n=1 Tax=Sesamum alatum TaxID=300844 RepID=A0AAE1YR25_9LAMI|nr:protein MAIN-LIKE 1 [Sesamum alatum]